jgi:hypothetical protein
MMFIRLEQGDNGALEMNIGAMCQDNQGTSTEHSRVEVLSRKLQHALTSALYLRKCAFMLL